MLRTRDTFLTHRVYIFEVFNAFLMKTALFCFDSFSLPVSGSGNTKIKRFQFPEFGLFVRQYEPPDIARY